MSSAHRALLAPEEAIASHSCIMGVPTSGSPSAKTTEAVTQHHYSVSVCLFVCLFVGVVRRSNIKSYIRMGTDLWHCTLMVGL